MSAPLFPHELHPEPAVRYRIEGDKRGRHHQLFGRAEDEARRDRMVAALEAAHWVVTTHEEMYVRQVAGAMDHDRHEVGRGEDRE